MATVALEFVPPSAEGGPAKAREEAARVRDLLRKEGIADRVNAVLVPGMIAEESDRPVPLEDKMDPLDVRRAIRETLPLDCIVTQVTAFSSMEALGERLASLRAEGIDRVVFVGVPRTLADGEGPGVAPTDALGHFRAEVPQRGVIWIPTRQDEKPRFEAKVRAGATFALSQLLCSDHVTRFVPTLEVPEPRPELLLSFGYVPKAESRVGLIRWLIRDETAQAKREMEWVAEVAERPFPRKKEALVDVYKRVIDGLQGCGFPLGVHFECPYGFNPYAFEVFHAMLDHWTPEG
jgi:hypothetical protein